ncbi:flagellin lysine-N-methylase [Pantoea sp. At-9b]|uniref:flagellin lysine-N-methylase n=1 Tax=Pantoea sp. (strain At-9b) TaxID=592316 RepID=UPI0001B403DC|nr:flagellin lysine-N-methylase [Pantoea sp. At-9b]ADU72400.1 flagellin lysine-N-methylase [Pantoea sp. At-9b]
MQQFGYDFLLSIYSPVAIVGHYYFFFFEESAAFMEEIVIVEPAFFNQFQCVGSACPDHCCKGWDIELDEPAVNRYMQSEAIEIRQIAVENIITTKESQSRWGKIKLTSNGNCTFLDEDRLCKVHKSLGEKALSTTCAIYPRLYASYKYEIRSNLTLSCPEAAKKLLTTPGAMLYSEKIKPSPEALDAPDISEQDRLLNLMCTNIMLTCGSDIDAGFYGIILLFFYRDKLEKDNEPEGNILNYFEDIQTAIYNGQIRKNIDELNPNYPLQSELFSRLQTYLNKKHEGRGWSTLRRYSQRLHTVQSNNSADTMQRLNKIWQDKARPWFQERSHLLSNYIQYRMYEDFFPLKNGRELFTNLYLMISEWLLLKWLTAARFALNDNFTEDDVINIVYSYHSIARHDKNAEDAFLTEIGRITFNDHLSLAYLLK